MSTSRQLRNYVIYSRWFLFRHLFLALHFLSHTHTHKKSRPFDSWFLSDQQMEIEEEKNEAAGLFLKTTAFFFLVVDVVFFETRFVLFGSKKFIARFCFSVTNIGNNKPRLGLHKPISVFLFFSFHFYWDASQVEPKAISESGRTCSNSKPFNSKTTLTHFSWQTFQRTLVEPNQFFFFFFFW